MAAIYLSSTYSDLRECREAIYHVLRRMQHDVRAMEDYVATDQRPLDKCIADVTACDLYIGIFAWRYGYIPLEGNPQQKSITELEYRKAIETGKSSLIFLLDEQASWPATAMDVFTKEGSRGEFITALRQELAREKLVSFFKTCEQLVSLVSAAVSNWEKLQSSVVVVEPLTAARTRYLEGVCRRYSTITLPVGPAEGFSLHAVFQPLALRRDPLAAADLAREKRRALLGEASLDENDPSYLHLEWPEKYSSKHSRQPPIVMIADHGDDAVKKSPQGRLIILGGPGTGKTTTLKYLISDRAKKALTDPDAPVPIFLSLADLVRSGKTLQHYLTDIVDDMGADRNYADILRKDIERGRAFICLDSLDEVDPRQRTRVIELINTWAADTDNTWVIGSRFTEYKGGQFRRGQFAEWELLPMNHALQQELAERLLSELQRLLPDGQGHPCL